MGNVFTRARPRDVFETEKKYCSSTDRPHMVNKLFTFLSFIRSFQWAIQFLSARPLLRRGALGPIRIRKTEQKNIKIRKTAVNYNENRKPHIKPLNLKS